MLEDAVDGGGPSQEFSCLLAKAIRNSVCEGSSDKNVLMHDSIGLEVRLHILCMYMYTANSCTFLIRAGEQVLLNRTTNGHDNRELW